MRGIMMSTTMRSGRSASAMASPSAPSRAVSTRKPSATSAYSISSTRSGSSSTSRIVAVSAGSGGGIGGGSVWGQATRAALEQCDAPRATGGPRSLGRPATAPMPVDQLLYVLDLTGVAVFAASGALAAGRKHLDLFGVYVLAVVTATGGGTLRDVLLDRHPVFWIADPVVLVVALAAASVTVAAARWGTPRPRLLRIADALGLGLFAVAGAQAAEAAGAPAVIVVVMGMMTGTFGGVIRDVLTGEIPLILRPGRLYATAAALGPAVYLGLKAVGVGAALAAAVGAVATIGLRFAAILLGIRLPVFILDVEPDDSV